MDSGAGNVENLVLYNVSEQYSTMFNNPFNQNVTGFQARYYF